MPKKRVTRLAGGSQRRQLLADQRRDDRESGLSARDGDEEEASNRSRPGDVVKLVISQDNENKSLKAEVKQLKRDMHQKDALMAELRSSLIDMMNRCRQKDKLLKDSSRALSRTIDQISAMEHVLKHGKEYVEVASSSTTPTTPTTPDDSLVIDAAVCEESHQSPNTPTSNVIELGDVPSRHSNNQLHDDVNSFFADHASHAGIGEDNGSSRPLGAESSLPVATAVHCNEEDMRLVLNGVLTSLNGDATCTGVYPALCPLQNIQNLDSGPVKGTLPSFETIVHGVPPKEPSSLFQDAFGEFVLKDGKEDDVAKLTDVDDPLDGVGEKPHVSAVPVVETEHI